MPGLYIHVPFCERKCIYCDFYSMENLSPMDDFIDALRREIGLYAEHGKGEEVETIFFGGGTPSLLPPATIGGILTLLHSTFHIRPDAEITMEANPGTVDRVKLKEYRDAGVNRMSFGVQSFFEEDLKFLGRIHTVDEAYAAFDDARTAGFTNLGIDLIYALPHQTPERWKENLKKVVTLGVPHISAYSLIIEENTPLIRMVRSGQVSPLPAETEAAMYEQTMKFLAENGFGHYEVSNYSRPGWESRHNRNYWNHSNYLGFGPSAHSFWNGRRWWNFANLSTYINKLQGGIEPLAGEETLSREELFEEAIMLGFRSGGIDTEEIRIKYGVNLIRSGRINIIDELVTAGLAVQWDHRITLTDKGYLLCDEISERVVRMAGKI